ncbi:MAG: hypothetical protein JNL39_02015, partial [Opitutaceae bacterium]|nr:hypothetical protein [Opitutaceae bacterium]
MTMGVGGVLVATLALAAAPLAAPTNLDFAPAATPAREGAVVLTPAAADRFDAARGYGWVTPPTGAFTGPAAWSGVRSPALCDGVSG